MGSRGRSSDYIKRILAYRAVSEGWLQFQRFGQKMHGRVTGLAYSICYPVLALIGVPGQDKWYIIYSSDKRDWSRCSIYLLSHKYILLRPSPAEMCI